MKIMPDKRLLPSVPTEAEIAARCARSLKIRQQMVTEKEIRRLEKENEKLRHASQASETLSQAADRPIHEHVKA